MKRISDEEIHNIKNLKYNPDMDEAELFMVALKGVAQAQLDDDRGEVKERITAPIICLCGSTRFTHEMLIRQWELTKQGYIVVSWCALPDDYNIDALNGDTTHIGDKEGVKELVDEVHKRKIDLCDEVFVLNINGYIGESTASEIAYAQQIGRPIKYYQALKQKHLGE